jgi:hypothetical protein
MKSFKIEWNLLNGEFPTEIVESCDLSVSIHKLSLFKEEIELTSKLDEDITPDIIFKLGYTICLLKRLALS